MLSVIYRFSFLYIQSLLNDCLHIEDLHLLFCAHFMNIFSFCRVLNLDIVVVSPLCPSVPSVFNIFGCQIYVICNNKSFHAFIFKMCTSYFVHIHEYFLILWGVELRHFSSQKCLCGLVCVIRNSICFTTFIFQLCTFHNDCLHIEDVLQFCAHSIFFFHF